MNGFLSCHSIFLLVKRGLRKSVLAAALICIAVGTVSCRTPKEIHTTIDSVIKTDTTEIYIHDTTKVVEVKHDSVDRYVEKILYVDSNGVWHEKEIERLTKYIYESNDYYQHKIDYYKDKVSTLERRLSEEKLIEYVEKDLNWLQKTLMGLGVCFLLALIGFGIYLFLKLKRKVT